MMFYFLMLKWQTYVFNQMKKKAERGLNKKSLYMSSVGGHGKEFLRKIIQRFGHEDFDYLIVVYDDTEFHEDVFARCQFIRDKGLKWQFIKRYVSPELGKKYRYLFLWDDDIDIAGFSPQNYLDIIERNNLQCSQPALARGSSHSHEITLRDEKYKIGRYTDFVEIMACVVEGEVWSGFWSMIEDDYNFWGWGYDLLGRSIVGMKNMGIVDQEPVLHVRPLRGYQKDSGGDFERFKQQHKRQASSKFMVYGGLK